MQRLFNHHSAAASSSSDFRSSSTTATTNPSTTTTATHVAIPAIVVLQSGDKNDESSPPFFFFKTTLIRMVYDMNRRVGYEAFSIQSESRLNWTIMGSESCDFLLFTLDPSFTCFTVVAFLPVYSEVIWHFSRGGMRVDIQKALNALFA